MSKITKVSNKPIRFILIIQLVIIHKLFLSVQFHIGNQLNLLQFTQLLLKQLFNLFILQISIDFKRSESLQDSFLQLVHFYSLLVLLNNRLYLIFPAFPFLPFALYHLCLFHSLLLNCKFIILYRRRHLLPVGFLFLLRNLNIRRLIILGLLVRFSVFSPSLLKLSKTGNMRLEVITTKSFVAVNADKRGRSAATKRVVFGLFLLKSRITVSAHESDHNVEITIQYDEYSISRKSHQPNRQKSQKDLFCKLFEFLIIYPSYCFYSSFSQQSYLIANNKMSYLNAQTLEKSILGKSVLIGQVVHIQQTPDIENIPGLKLKNQQQFANAQICNICKQPFNQQRGVNRHHCRFCASSICGECSRKKINKERACDFCFLKQHLKKQQHERKDNFRQREQNIEKMNGEIKQFQQEIEQLDKEIIVIDKANVEMEVNNLKEFNQRQEEVRRKQDELKTRQEDYEKKKKQLQAKKQELETRQERNKHFASKVQIIKLDISSKQSALLQKMQELERLKIQLDKLQSQRAELMKEFK